MTLSVQDLQTLVNQIENDVTRSAAAQLLNIARDNPAAIEHVQNLLSLNATATGTAIFYSGVGPNGLSNFTNAVNIKEQVLLGNGYLYSDTEAGSYLDAYISDSAESLGYLPLNFRSAAITFISAKMADQAIARRAGQRERNPPTHPQTNPPANHFRTPRRVTVLASAHAPAPRLTRPTQRQSRPSKSGSLTNNDSSISRCCRPHRTSR